MVESVLSVITGNVINGSMLMSGNCHNCIMNISINVPTLGSVLLYRIIKILRSKYLEIARPHFENFGA